MLRAVDTFVIRLWSPAALATGDGDDPRGVARHVGTGRAAAFRDGDELLALLRALRQPAVVDAETERAEAGATGAGPA
jgi:hypothetical protein